MTSANRVRWQIVGNPVFIAGFVYGLRHPSVIVISRGRALSPDERAVLSRLIVEVAPSLDKLVEEAMWAGVLASSWAATVAWMLAVVHHVQRAVGLPIYESGCLLAAAEDSATCCIPLWAFAGQQHIALLQALFQVFEEASDERVQAFGQTLAELGKTSPKSSNVPRFMRAAFDLGIPFLEMPGEVVQYGIGRQSRWLESSFTEETTRISARIARDKRLTAQVLRRAGLPVPGQHVVTDADFAIHAAEKLGYPVVVKPLDADGGAGVFVHLRSAHEVQMAFAKASAFAPNILVEKHLFGRDYRVVVFRDEVIIAIERIPGGITGDGQHTVEELLARFNADPRRGASAHAPLKPVPLDDEARGLLAEAGLDPSSIPAEGRFVRLRQAANVASGGMPVGVLDQVHPDNLRLAIHAARALRLDLAGIDLLMPDISRSWRETGAGICEVNAQPNLGQIVTAGIYVPLLRKIVPGNGRIPTVVVLGAAPKSRLCRALELALLDKRVSVGCHDTDGVRIQGEVIIDGAVSPFVAGTALVVDKTVSAMIISIDDVGALRTGLPFAKYDVLVLAGSHIAFPDNAQEHDRQQLLLELFAGILPGCDGRVMMLEGSGLHTRGLERMTPASWDAASIAPPRLIAEIVGEIMKLESKHEGQAV